MFGFLAVCILMLFIDFIIKLYKAKKNKISSAPILEITRGNPQKTIMDFDKDIGINPNDANLYHERAVAHFSLGNKKQAIKDFDKAIEINPKDANVYNNRGSGNLSMCNYQQAIKDFSNAIDINPNKLNKLGTLPVFPVVNPYF
ncbi:MAG: tetratricopeptide repeat protein [Pedobacter sp.]